MNANDVRAPMLSGIQYFVAFSQTYKDFMGFIRLCNDAVTGVRASSQQQQSAADSGSSTVSLIVEMLREMASWVDDIPPIDEPMRFGNKAFR